MSATLRQQVGQLVIAGLEGTALTSTERAWLKLIRPAGIILFRRNIEEPEQTIQLLREATEIAGGLTFRCVDLEGGLVDRLRDLIAPMPSPAAVFATRKPALFKKHGRLIAQEARSLGFNTVFAPVLDLGLSESSAVMRTRVVSPDPAQVTAYASAFLQGFAAEGIVGCGKHFPGLGGGTLDSHHAMPTIERTWDAIWQEDLAPYRALAPQLPMIMVAHAAYPQAAKNSIPASISPFWVGQVLRKKLGFSGIVISDDMEMGGILTQRSMEEAAVEAIAAGTDLLEVCKDPSLVLRAYEALLTEAEHSPVFRRKVYAATHRIKGHKQQLLSMRFPKPPSPQMVEKIRDRVNVFTGKVSESATSF